MTAWALHTLIATSVLMLAVLLIRRPVARAFGPGAAYALWLAPAARLFLPPLPEAAPASQLIIETTAISGGGGLPVAALQQSSLGQALLAAWLGGAALFLLFQVAAHRRFVGRAVRHGRPLEAMGGLEVIESAQVEGPIATGILRKRILLPVGLAERLGKRQCRLALLHEQLHHERRDLHALSLAVVVLALHWFNPLAYLAHRAFRRDLEAACDAQLAQQLGRDEREDYARAIIGCAAAPVPHAICTLTTIDDLKRRLKMLNRNHGRAARLAGGGLAAILAAGGLAVTAQAHGDPQGPEPKVERVEIRKTVKDGKVVEETGMTPELRAKLAQCEGEKFEAHLDGPPGSDKKLRNKVFICLKKGANPAATITALEDAAKRIESEDDLRADGKQEILLQLRSRIAELRAR